MEDKMFKIGDDMVTDAKIMRSNAGYYVGREYSEFGMLLPYDRFTGYFKTREQAEDILSLYEGKDSQELSIVGLVVIGGMSQEQAKEFVYHDVPKGWDIIDTSVEEE